MLSIIIISLIVVFLFSRSSCIPVSSPRISNPHGTSHSDGCSADVVRVALPTQSHSNQAHSATVMLIHVTSRAIYEGSM